MTDEEARLLVTMLPNREMTLDDVFRRAVKTDVTLTRGIVRYRLSKLVESGRVKREYTPDRVSCYMWERP